MPQQVCENDLVIAGISQASLDPDLRIHVTKELNLPSHSYNSKKKTPVGSEWSLCKLSHPLVDFVEVRD